MTATTDTPGGTVEHFSVLLEAGRLDALLALYEDGAAFVPEPGTLGAFVLAMTGLLARRRR